MRKIFLLSFFFCVSFCLFAQEIVTDDIERTNLPESKNVSFSNSVGKNDYKKSGGTIDFYIPEKGFGMAMNLAFKYFFLEWSMRYGETDDVVTTNDGWSLGAGGHYRHWIGDWVFVEGFLGIEYLHSKIAYKNYTSASKYKTEEIKDGNIAMMLHPKIGVHLYKGFSIAAGYRWDFNEFKFKKGYVSDFFTLSLGFVM